MVNDPVGRIGENSPEQIAYKLLQDIVAMEGKQISAQGDDPTDREWYLATFAECLSVVRDPDVYFK